MDDNRIAVVAGGWKALADALYEGRLTEATISITDDRIVLEGWKPSESDAVRAAIGDAVADGAVGNVTDAAARVLGTDVNADTPLATRLLFVNLAEEPDAEKLFLGTHAAEMIAGIAAEHYEKLRASSFKFQLGSEVVLVTSREALVAQRKSDAEASKRATASSISSGGIVSGTLMRFHGPIERGEVIGRAEYATSPASYLVRYRAGDGRQTEAWFEENALFQEDELDAEEPGE